MNIVDAVLAYPNRPKGLRNPAVKEFAENILQNAADDRITDEAFAPYVLHQMRSIDVRLEPYANSPVKGLVSVPLEDPALDGVRTELLLALTRVARRAYQDAALKVLVERQPG